MKHSVSSWYKAEEHALKRHLEKKMQIPACESSDKEEHSSDKKVDSSDKEEHSSDKEDKPVEKFIKVVKQNRELVVVGGLTLVNISMLGGAFLQIRRKEPSRAEKLARFLRNLC